MSKQYIPLKVISFGDYIPHFMENVRNFRNGIHVDDYYIFAPDPISLQNAFFGNDPPNVLVMCVEGSALKACLEKNSELIEKANLLVVAFSADADLLEQAVARRFSVRFFDIDKDVAGFPAFLESTLGKQRNFVGRVDGTSRQ